MNSMTMKEMLDRVRDRKANFLYGCPYSKLLTNHKDCVDAVIRVDFDHYMKNQD